MRKAIREYLEAKLRALEHARADGTEVQGLPGRIIFGPAPKNAIEAGLHGVLEGLYVSGKLNGREAGEWHAKFRSAMAAPGDPGTVSILIGGSIPADVAARNEPWAPDTMIAAVEPEIPARDHDSGLLALKRAELYPFGVTLHWTLELSEKAQANVQKARKDLGKSPPDLLEFHLTRTLLPACAGDVHVRCESTSFFAVRHGFQLLPTQPSPSRHKAYPQPRASGSTYGGLGRPNLRISRGYSERQCRQRTRVTATPAPPGG